MHPPTVVIAEPIDPAPANWLAQHARVINADSDDRPALLRHLTHARALVVRTYTIVDHDLLDHAPQLRVVARAGAGLDNIDLDACARRGIAVVHTPAANTTAVVEYVIQMMLTALRPIATFNAAMPDAAWHTLREESITPTSCVGTRLGIIGLGRIGSRVAKVAGALGMEVFYHDIAPIDPQQRYGATPIPLDELIASCPVITIHADGRAGNRHLLNARLFSLMRPDALLINAARGFLMDPHAAAAFAHANPHARLILDVHDPEPVSPDSPLLGLPNVTLTPHIAAGTQDAKQRMSWVVRDVMRVLGDQPPHHRAI